MLTAPTIRARWPRMRTTAAAFEAAIEAVGVARRNHGERRRPLGGEARAVADRLAGAHALDRDDAAGQRHDRRERDASWPAAAERRRGAAGRAARSRTRRANRAAARRCWPRGGTAAARRARASVAHAASNASALLVEERVLGLVGGREVRVDALRARDSGSRAAPAASTPGSRGGTRGDACRCRSSGDSGRACRARRGRRLQRAARPTGLAIVGVRSYSKTPSRSLTLSAPKIRIRARVPDSRSSMPSSMSATASQRRAGFFERARHAHRAVPVGVGLDDRDDAGRRGRPARRGAVERRLAREIRRRSPDSWRASRRDRRARTCSGPQADDS